MANSIEIAEFFSKEVDRGYLATSKTAAILNSNAVDLLDNGYGKIKVKKITTSGIGTYDDSDPASGYANGATTLTWEDIEPDLNLSGAISIDHYDDVDALKDNLIEAYADMQDKLVREVDAIRFASIVKQAPSDRVIAETITDGADAVAKIRTALNVMDNKRVYNDKVLYATPEILGALDDMDLYKSQAIKARFSQIVMVESDIFVTAVKVGTGRNNDWNFTKESTAKQINFMIVSASAVAAKAETRAKYIESEDNYDRSSMKFRFRGLSAHVFDNKKDGIYVSTAE